MPLTPQDVRNKEFGASRFRRGYHESEVDAFLDEVETELTRLLTENEALRTRVHTLAGHGGAGPEARATASDRTGAAQRAASTGSAAASPTGSAAASPAAVPDSSGRLPGEGAEAAALRTLQMAQRTADETVADARAEAERMLAEARERAAELDGRHSDAEASVERLRAFEREYRQRLKAYFETQLHELENGAARLEPARAAEADVAAGPVDLGQDAGPAGA